MAYRKVRHSEKFPGGSWWAGEVADATGAWYPLDGVWARNLVEAAGRFLEISKSWETHTHDPILAAAMTEQILKDGAHWGFD